jgi:hypothetical protein
MVEGVTEGWRIYAWRENMKTILATALRCSDTCVQQAAADLVNRLCARGYLVFRELLSER